MEPIKTREQFFLAAQSGDASAIAAFFAHGASGPEGGVPAVCHERRAGHEWLRPLDGNERARFEAPTSLISLAVARDYASVLEWLISVEAMERIASERLVIAIVSACKVAMRANARALLELLLVSPVFTTMLPGEQQQRLLDGLLCPTSAFPAPDMVRLLTAHGASIGRDDVLNKAAAMDDVAHAEAVVCEGAFTAGALVLDNSTGLDALGYLLKLGCRSSRTAECFHHEVLIARLLSIELWLERGFVDVDARDSEGQTPLMRVAWFGSDRRQVDGTNAAIAKLLLDYGASVRAEDDYGKTPLNHALGRHTPDVVRVLLEHGADRIERTNLDLAALDSLSLAMFHELSALPEGLEHVLNHGANPFPL